jgi:hypothetical protein
MLQRGPGVAEDAGSGVEEQLPESMKATFTLIPFLLPTILITHLDDILSPSNTRLKTNDTTSIVVRPPNHSLLT